MIDDYTYRRLGSVEIKAAFDLVERYHYSGRRPNCPSVVAGALFQNRVVAACFMCHPPTRWGEPVLELTRLVRDPNHQRVVMTKLVAACCDAVKQTDHPKLIVSFADSQQAHHGGVYQACSWNYHVLRKPRLEGFVINGDFAPCRSLYDRYGTSSKAAIEKICSELGLSCEPRYDTGKHLYWRALNKAARRQAERLGLQSNPYPKPTPDRGLFA